MEKTTVNIKIYLYNDPDQPLDLSYKLKYIRSSKSFLDNDILKLQVEVPLNKLYYFYTNVSNALIKELQRPITQNYGFSLLLTLQQLNYLFEQVEYNMDTTLYQELEQNIYQELEETLYPEIEQNLKFMYQQLKYVNQGDQVEEDYHHFVLIHYKYQDLEPSISIERKFYFPTFFTPPLQKQTQTI